MLMLNFKKRFAPAVEAGEKRQTIRAHRKDGKRPQPGDHLRLYTGLRTKECRKLMDAICTDVSSVHIFDDVSDISIVIAGRRLTRDEGRELANADGFNTRAEFLGFFSETHGLPFDGLMIEWEPKPYNAQVTGGPLAARPVD
mgnify:FL=1